MTRGHAFLVGGTGFIGSHLARALVDGGWSVTAFAPPGPGGPMGDLAGRIALVRGNATDQAEMQAGMGDARPDLVVSLIGHNASGAGLLRASEADVDQALRVNALGLRNVLEASLRTGVRRVLWTSSVVAYGPPHLYRGRRVTEDDRLAPVTAYGLTKALAEQISAFYRDAHGLDVSAIRLPLVFGPGRWYAGVLGSILSLLTDEAAPQPVRVGVAQSPFDLAYIADVVEAIMCMARHPEPLGSRYNVAGATTTFVGMIEAIAERRPDLRVELGLVPDDPLYPLMSDSLIAREIGFTCAYSLDRALDDYLTRAPRA